MSQLTAQPIASETLHIVEDLHLAPASAGPKVQLLRRNEAETIEAFGERMHLLLPAKITGGQSMFVEAEIPAGSGPPYHVHHNEDETFFIREGKFEFTINGERHEVEPGDVVFAPRDVPHTFRNISDDVAVMQILAVSAGFESFFRACEEALKCGAGMDRITEIAFQHGIEFVSPDAPPVALDNGKKTPRIIRKGESEKIAYPGAVINSVISEVVTNGEYAVISGSTSPGDGPPPHIHSGEDEIFVLHEGEIAFGSGSDAFLAGPGDVVYAPRGTRHIFRCVSTVPASGLILIMPGSFVGYFRDVAALYNAGQICPENLAHLFEKYGLQSIEPSV